jgi:aryl-alcohol dehydrogenase-like predicted oxidoreductase
MLYWSTAGPRMERDTCNLPVEEAPGITHRASWRRLRLPTIACLHSEEYTVQYREVGNTGIRVSEIAFGGGGNAGLMVKGTARQQLEAIERAIELGINYFDQAPDYGDGISESNLGRVLKQLGVRPYITTKVEVRDRDLADIAGHVERSLDASLERLGVDYVDFVQIHNGPVTHPPELKGPSYTHLSVNDYLRSGGALEGLQRVQAAGKARFIGFITRGNDADASRQLIDTGAFNLINVSVNLINPSAAGLPKGMSVKQDWGGILGYAHAHNVGAAVYSPLASWYLSDAGASGGASHPLGYGARTPETEAVGRQQARMLGFLSKNLHPDTQADDHDLAQAALRYVMSLEGVTSVLGGFSDAEQVTENAASSGKGPLSEQNMARIEMVWRGNFGLEA